MFEGMKVYSANFLTPEGTFCVAIVADDIADALKKLSKNDYITKMAEKGAVEVKLKYDHTAVIASAPAEWPTTA